MSRIKILDALALSMRVFGQLQPIIVGANGEIIDGHLRNEACRLASIEPWRITRDDLKPEARLHFLIRREFGPLEMADLAAHLSEAANPSGARRAPGTGKTKDVVAQQMREQFGQDISPREAAYALSLAKATPDERAAVQRAAPPSMRAAQQALNDHRSGVDAKGVESEPETRTELLKRAYEFRAAVIRHQAPISNADRTMLLELRAVIDRMLESGGHHAPS